MKKVKEFLSILMAFFIIPNLVVGLGVSPASKTLDFQPNTTIEVELNIINSEHASFEAALSASGEFAEIIFFEEQVLKIDSSIEQIPFKVIFKLPSEMEPGIHKSFIKITPIVESTGSDMFAAYISPQIPLSLRVPYPNKYADIRLVVLGVDEGTPVPLFVEFDNLGSEKIQKAGADIGIYSPDNTLLVSLAAPPVSVEKSSLGKTRAEPSPILRKGVYVAFVNAYYDEFGKNFTMNFSVGEPIIRVKQLLTRELGRDSINKVIFRAYNEWNTPLAVQGFLESENLKNEIPVFVLGSYEEKEVTGFFDTTGLEPGEYNLSIILSYAGVVRTERFIVRITEKILEKPALSQLLILLVVLLIILFSFIVLIIVKKRKRTGERNL